MLSCSVRIAATSSVFIHQRHPAIRRHVGKLRKIVAEAVLDFIHAEGRIGAGTISDKARWREPKEE